MPPVSSKSAVIILFGLAMLMPATAQAADRVLSFAVSGVVQEVMAKPGQKVRQGEPLIRLDDRVFAACTKAAGARVAAAGAALEVASKDYADTKELYDGLSASGAQLAEANIALKEAEAVVAQAEAKEVRCAWRLERSTLRAPSSGTVKSIPGYVGMVVNPRVQLTPVVVLEAE